MPADGNDEIEENVADPQVDELNRLARVQGGASVDEGEDPHAVIENLEEYEVRKEAMPWVELPRQGKTISAFAMECGNVCKLNGVFRRDKVPVTINRESGKIDPLDGEEFSTYFEDVAVTYKSKWNPEGDETRLETTMTKDVANRVLKTHQFLYRQRQLEKVNQVQQPIVRKDGRIELLKTGFDAESGIFTMPSDIEVRNDMSLKEARQLLLALHREFDFSDWNEDRTKSRDLAAHIGAMLSFYGADLLSPLASRLGALYNANSHRSGKTLLFKIVVAPVIGRVKVRSMPKNDEEFRKMLDGSVLLASPYVILDDVGGNLRNNDLNAFMTSAYWSGRIMHTQREFEMINRSMVFITGHSLTVESDLAGRLLQCKLHLEEADVRNRKIGRVIDDGYLSKPEIRSDILTALWTIVREWDRAGRDPKPSTKMGGFEQWCEIFGSMVEFAGFGDPCARPPEDESADSEYEDMLAVVTALADLHDDYIANDPEVNGEMVEFTFAKVVEVALSQNAFAWIIDGRWIAAEGENPRRYEASAKAKAILGLMWSSKYGGRKFTLADGRRVKFGNRGKNRHKRYQLTRLNEQAVAV